VLGEAELARLEGTSDPELWAAAATAWERLGEPYPTAYARWREAEALLLGGHGREQIEPSLRAAHATASELGAAPLRAVVEALARRGRLSLGTDPATTPAPAPPATIAARPTRPHGPRAGGAGTGGGRADQRPDRRDAVHQPQDGHRARLQHPGKLVVRNRVEVATIAHRLGIVKPGS
jgi:hypothetical protein